MRPARRLAALALLFVLPGCAHQISSADEEYEKAQKEIAEATVANIEASPRYLEENRKRPGVIVTASGLQYEIVRPGDTRQPVPALEAMVRVHYEGALPNGKVFDSTYARGAAVQLPVKGLVAGWTEALQLMHPGSEFRLVIPANLHHGEEGQGAVPGNQVVIYKVELLGYRDAAGNVIGEFQPPR